MSIEKLVNSDQENLSKSKRSKDLEIFTRTLCDFVRRVDLFGTDETDEFRVRRETGETQGIFKTWAVPVIPFLETNTLDELTKSLSNSGKFSQRLTPESEKVMNDWFEEMSAKPLKLWESLEKWRGFTEIMDRRLQVIFSGKKLPDSKQDRVAELYLRLTTAFAFGSPFYHLEAMAGDTQETQFNPIINSADTTDISGGGLDLVAMALPSALKNKISVKKLDWAGLNWEKINKVSKPNIDDPEYILAFRIAKTIGVDVEDVIFAANALEWIPVSVAGKIDDLPEKDAQTLIVNALKPSKLLNPGAAGRNINALIRFFNWFPLIKGDENFDGKAWRYAAACDTSDALLAEVNSGGVLNAEFEGIFKSSLTGQVGRLDATSAKGRFMIQLLNEGRVIPEISQKIKERAPAFFEDISRKLATLEGQEAIIDLNEAKPRSLVGGKAAGLREAGLIFGKENVIPGVVITAEAIENWLRQFPNIWNAITKLNSLKNVNEKLLLAETISEEISANEFPANIASNNKLSVRSSSFDEDTDFNGTAAGIYESVVDISPTELKNAVSKVVSSFFSEKAVSYRHLQGLGDLPMFAVVISPFIEGCGGAAFSGGNDNDWEIVVAEKPSNVVGGVTGTFDSYKKEGGIVSSVAENEWVDAKTINQIGILLNMAEKATGERVDLEFTIDQNGKIWVLQLRSIRQATEQNKKKDFSHLKIIKFNSLDGFQIEGKLDKDIKLVIGNNINIDQFQGSLFRWLTINRERVKQISLSRRIPRTSHFANLCINLGIDLIFEENE